MSEDVSRETTRLAQERYERVPGMSHYVQILATTGVERGLLGPREVPRLWTRHIANCAVVAEHEDLVPMGASVIDVGSGAGLPGLVWALVRTDLQVVLLEPLLRRSVFLTETVEQLGLPGRVTVVRGRAESYSGPLADVVTARAVASLGSLAKLTLPLARGRLLALKGETAQRELHEARDAVAAVGGKDAKVVLIDGMGLDRPATVVVVDRDPHFRGPATRRGGR